jgi:cardiolipin synthase (CMP-forming)
VNNFTISNFFTLIRIVITPVVVITMMRGDWVKAILLFGVAVLTDFLDGFCARLFNQETVLGAYLDPFADKFLILSCYVALVLSDIQPFRVPMWFIGVVFLKETIIVVGALLQKFYGLTKTIKPTVLGKMTAVMQMCFIMWLLNALWLQKYNQTAFNLFLILVFLFSVVSCIQYVVRGLVGIDYDFQKTV